MKYAIPKDYSEKQDGSDIRYENPVSIPDKLPDWASDAAAFLAKLFPDLTGFIEVPEDTGMPAPIVLVPSQKQGRNLTWDEFLAVGMATDATKINAILVKLPVAAEWGRKYEAVPGIEFADAVTPGTRLKLLLDTAQAMTIIDDATIAAFIANWIAIFPLMVPET